jgi:hypothetical protein
VIKLDLEKAKDLQHKIIDYKRYAFILIAVSVFLYIGVLIPNEGKTSLQMVTIMGTTVLFLSVSFLLFRRVIKYKQELSEIDQ